MDPTSACSLSSPVRVNILCMLYLVDEFTLCLGVANGLGLCMLIIFAVCVILERQKEITQKEADARRQKREEEKMVELRQRAEASMLKHTGKSAAGFSHADYHGRRKKQLGTNDEISSFSF